MISPGKFRELVSGRKRGPAAMLLRGLLRACETPYSLIMDLRNRRYDRATADIHRADVPVISVGNLTLGGTGKTPLVEWIARFFQQSGVRVSIVSRGYGAPNQGRNDEALELELALPEVPQLQNSNRAEAAQMAVEQFQSELILLDDGFQHRRLHRDLDILLVDATEPFGFEHVFPRGTLREPLRGLRRADVVVLSRADMLDASARKTIRERVAQLAPAVAWCEVEHAPQHLLNHQAELQPLDSLAGKRIAAFCGIGNPAGFHHTLDSLGAKIANWREFPDHHCYTQADVESLASWASGADLVVCTRKDLVKLPTTDLGKTPLWSVSVSLHFSAGQEIFEARLAEVLSSLQSPRAVTRGHCA